MAQTSGHAPVRTRSLLYVPGDQQAPLDKSLERGADAVIVDLEDAVAPARKATARAVTRDWIQRNSARSKEIWVRINADAADDDIGAITGPVAGIIVPKASRRLLSSVDELLTARENMLGIAQGATAVIALMETAQGLLDAVAVAESPRVGRLAIGRADLAADLGLTTDPEGPEFGMILLQLVIASAAAGIAAPIAPVSTDFRDLDALRASTERLMKLGFRGRTAIHPAQLSTINEVFTPSRGDVERAQRVVASFEEAENAGTGVVLDEDGRMVDLAVVRSARDVLARAGLGDD